MENSVKSKAQWEFHFRSRPGSVRRSLSISRARKELPDLPNEVQEEPIYITRHGRPVMTLLSVALFEGLLETLEVLSDRTFATRLYKGMDQAAASRTLTLEEAAARLGL